MGFVSNWGAGHIGRALFSKADAVLTTYYVGLINGDDPTSYFSGSELDEPADASYARQAIANDTLSWSEQDYGRMVNTNAVSFPAATVEWGQVRWWVICNAATAGQVIFYGRMAHPAFVDVGDQLVIGAGGIKIQIPSEDED